MNGGVQARPLRVMAEVALGRQRSPEHASGSHMVKYLRAGNVKDGYFVLSDVLTMNFTPSEQSTFALQDGDILVTEGAGSLAAVGANAVWRDQISGTVCFQNTLLRLRARPGNDPRFVGWWARYAYESGLFAAIATGANIFHLSADRARSVRVWIPSGNEQKAIADHLDAEVAENEALVDAQERRIALLREWLEVAREDWVRAAISKAGAVPLRRVARGIEQGWSPQCENVQAKPTEWGVIKTSAVTSGTFRPTENKLLPPEVAPDPRWIIRDGDFLVARGSGSAGHVGRGAVARTDGARLLLSDLTYRVRLSGRNPEFLAEVFESSFVRAQIRGTVRSDAGLTLKIRGDDLKSILVPNTPPDEQAALVAQLRATLAPAREAELRLQREVDLLVERRRTLVAAAVLGDVVTDQAA